jgi:hypothetical protein
MSGSSESPPEYSLNGDRVGDVTPAFESQSELIVGIDFGTTFSGVAYATTADIQPIIAASPDIKRAADKIVVNKTWPGETGCTEKTPTVLSYKNGSDAPPIWGARVKSNDGSRVVHFKLGLQEDIGSHYGDPKVGTNVSESVLGGFLENCAWEHPDLPGKTALDFARDYLTCLVKHVREKVLPTRFGPIFLRNQKLSYVITVPAIWSNKAKDLTRQAAAGAGIAPGCLTLITEPEASALFCATLCTEVDLREGDRFLICDAGGGTVVRQPPNKVLTSRTSLLITYGVKRLSEWRNALLEPEQLVALFTLTKNSNISYGND